MNEPCFYISFDSDEWYIYNKRPEWSEASKKFTFDSSEGIMGRGIDSERIAEQLKEVLGDSDDMLYKISKSGIYPVQRKHENLPIEVNLIEVNPIEKPIVNNVQNLIKPRRTHR